MNRQLDGRQMKNRRQVGRQTDRWINRYTHGIINEVLLIHVKHRFIFDKL